LRKQKRPGCGVLTFGLIVLFTILLFFFEWLGSEQSEKWVEKPIAMPKTAVQPDKSKD
jgi:hypothetical protein